MNKKFLLSLGILGLLTTSLNARDASLEDKISSLYISFFDRAPDYDGFTYWTQHGDEYLTEGKDALVALKELSSGFSSHPTFKSMYDSMSNEDFVKAIYRNSLGREGDTQGIEYWTGLLNDGLSRSDMVAEFMNLSLTLDLTTENFPNLSQSELDAAIERQTLIANKVSVAEAFVDTLGTSTNISNTQNPENDPAYIASQTVLENVGLEQSSVDDAIGKIYALKNDLPDAIDAICNAWDSIMPDYSFKNSDNFEQDAQNALFIYIFNNARYSDLESYGSSDYSGYEFQTVETNLKCTDYGFTPSQLTTSYDYQGIFISVYSDVQKGRTCTDSDYAGSAYAGTTNAIFYASSLGF